MKENNWTATKAIMFKKMNAHIVSKTSPVNVKQKQFMMMMMMMMMMIKGNPKYSNIMLWVVENSEGVTGES